MRRSFCVAICCHFDRIPTRISTLPSCAFAYFDCDIRLHPAGRLGCDAHSFYSHLSYIFASRRAHSRNFYQSTVMVVGYLTLLARPIEGADNDNSVEWYPLGRLLLWNIALAAALTVAGVWMLGSDYASFVEAFEKLLNELVIFEPTMFAGLVGADKVSSISTIANILALIAAPISAAISAAISVLLLYVAARIVKASDRLPRPWPDLATTAMPKVTLPVFLACLILVVLGADFIGLFGRIGLASLLVGFCLQGLAVLHMITRPLKSRRVMLVMIYSVFILLPGWPILGFAALGIADFWFNFRSRFNTAASPSTLS